MATFLRTRNSLTEYFSNIEKDISFCSKQTIPGFQKALQNVLPDEEGVIMSYAVNTHAGLVKQPNLDRVAIIQSSAAASKIDYSCKFSFFAIYEGIGNTNAEAANYLRDNLHKIIFRDLNFRKNPTLALVNSIKKCNKYIC